MELLQTLRKIRSCEGDAAAQLLLEAYVMQEVAAKREQCITVCIDLAIEHESYLPRYPTSQHLSLEMRLAQANTARVLADRIKFR